MEKVSSSLAVLAEKSRKKGLNLEYHLGGNLKIQICWRKTFHFLLVCMTVLTIQQIDMIVVTIHQIYMIVVHFTSDIHDSGHYILDIHDRSPNTPDIQGFSKKKARMLS